MRKTEVDEDRAFRLLVLRLERLFWNQVASENHGLVSGLALKRTAFLEACSYLKYFSRVRAAFNSCMFLCFEL